MNFIVNVYVGDQKIAPEEIKDIKINSETADRVISSLIEQNNTNK